MYNWSTDTTQLQKDPEKYAIWKIEQLVNFGLAGGRIQESDLKKYWDRIEIDPSRRKFLSLLIHA